MSDWCILRTKARNTLSLAASLAEAGLTAWTPAQILSSRAPRSKERIETTVPLMPTYVFATSDHLAELAELAEARSKPHVDFSVFRYLGRVPVLADASLNALRVAEARERPRKQQKTFKQGEIVRIEEGGFAGMSGVVEEGDGRYTLVMFGRIGVKIATFLLFPDEAHNQEPYQGNAAQAA